MKNACQCLLSVSQASELEIPNPVGSHMSRSPSLVRVAVRVRSESPSGSGLATQLALRQA